MTDTAIVSPARAKRLEYLSLGITYFHSSYPEDGQWKASLCHLCKYVYWYGGDDGGECEHATESISEAFNDVWAGDEDCEGFEPMYTLAKARKMAKAPIDVRLDLDGE